MTGTEKDGGARTMMRDAPRRARLPPHHQPEAGEIDGETSLPRNGMTTQAGFQAVAESTPPPAEVKLVQGAQSLPRPKSKVDPQEGLCER